MTNEEAPAAPIGAGALAGAVAWVIGYGVSYLGAAGRIEQQLGPLNAVVGLLGGGTLPPWKAVAWLYFNAHFVDVQVVAIGRTEALNLVARTGGNASLLYALPPLVLVGAVALVTFLANARSARLGAVGGAAAAAGYAVCAVATALLSAHAIGAVEVRVGLLLAFALAGVAYPLVFGAIGGLLGGALAGQLRS
jgi:hypothetical protein